MSWFTILMILVFLIDYNYAQSRRNITCLEEKYKCQNDGVCLTRVAAVNNYVCSCRSPYCGRTCTRRIPDCIEDDFDCEEPDQTCLNDGICIASPLIGGYICSCKVGFCGNRCSNRQPNCMLFA